LRAFKLLFALLSFTVFTETRAVSVARSFEESCVFQDGSRLEFKQHYKLDLVAAMIPADVTSTEDTGFDLRFIDKNGRKSEWLKSREFISYDGSKSRYYAATQRLCSQLFIFPNERFCYKYYCLTSDFKWSEYPNGEFLEGLLNTVVLSSKGEFCVNRYCLNGKGRWIRVSDSEHIKLPGKLLLSGHNDTLAEPIRSEMKKRQLSSILDMSRTLPVGKKLVHEQLLFDMSSAGTRKDGNSNITAVYQSESQDGGRTWSAPMITTDAKLFELGKSLDAQSFVGSAYSHNGKRFTETRPLQ
jgi:hypothetical protein